MFKLFLIPAFFLCVFNAYAASGCVLIGNKPAKIELEGKVFSPPSRHSNCEGLKVLAGEISACFIDKNQQKNCVQLQAGQVFNGITLNSLDGAGTAAFQATLMSMLSGDTHTPIGGSRNDSRLPGLPYSIILGIDNQIVFSAHLKALSGESIVEFDLTEDFAGSNTISFKPLNNIFIISTEQLNRGSTYFWSAKTKNNIYYGTFNLASFERLDNINKSINDSLKGNNLDIVSLRIITAEKYFDSGFPFDANQILLKLK